MTCDAGLDGSPPLTCESGTCGACAANPVASPRYVDNGDGTITDRQTCLVWEKKEQAGGRHDLNTSDTAVSGPSAAMGANPSRQPQRPAGHSRLAYRRGTDVTFATAGPAIRSLGIWVRDDGVGLGCAAQHVELREPTALGRLPFSAGRVGQGPTIPASAPAELESILFEPYYCSHVPCVDSCSTLALLLRDS